jgi:hypothetical protein
LVAGFQKLTSFILGVTTGAATTDPFATVGPFAVAGSPEPVAVSHTAYDAAPASTAASTHAVITRARRRGERSSPKS